MANNKQITGHQCVQLLAPPLYVKDNPSCLRSSCGRCIYTQPDNSPTGDKCSFFFLPFFLYTIKFDPLLFFRLFHLEIPTHTEQRKKIQALQDL